MKTKALRICSAFFAILIAGGIYTSINKNKNPLVVDVHAVSAPYDMTDEYKSGRYYDNLSMLELCGDGARDVLAIAMSQVGYHEGDSDSDFHGNSSTGTKDFVEYNVLYGKLDNDQGNGLSYGYYWCASFVNWCFRMAGISEAASGSEVSCQRWYEDCKDNEIYRSKNGYIPSSGDIVFFKDSGSPLDSTHVGLVRYSDGKHVYTIEGNTSNGNEYSSNGEYVALKKHEISSKYIVGYATPKYEKNKTAHTVDHSGGFLSIGQYISDADIPIFGDFLLENKQETKIDAFSVFSVVELCEGSLKISFDGNEGYISDEAGFVQLTTSEDIYTVNYLSEDGVMMFLPQYRRSNEQKSVYSSAPKKENSGFVGWCDSNMNDVFSPSDKLPISDRDITLTAVFDSNYYIVSFKNPDGTLIDQIHGYYGSKYEVPSNIDAPDGYIFSGWDEETDGVIRGNGSYTAMFILEGELGDVGAETDKASSKIEGCNSSISAIPVSCTLIALLAMIAHKRKR